MDVEQAATGMVFGFKKLVLVAGALGVVLGIVVRRQFHWWGAISAFLAGTGCVLFVAPFAVHTLGLKGVEEAESFAAWLAGLAGMYIVDFVFAVVRDPWSAWDRVRGRGGGGAP